MSSINPIRVTGLTTGLDTESIVKSMLSNEQSKIDKQSQNKQVIEWQQETYRDIIKQSKDFYNKYFSVTSQNNLLLSSNYSNINISSSENSVISAVAQSGATSIDYKISVENIAMAANKTSSFILVDGIKANGDIKLSQIGFVGDTNININIGTDTKLEVSISDSDTISDMITKINNSDSNIKASFSELTGKISIQTMDVGSSASIEMIESNNNLLDILGIDKDKSIGKNSNIKITTTDNEVIPLEFSSNSFTIDSISYNIYKAGTSHLTSTSNNQKIIENIESFANDYNKLIEKIDGIIREKKSYDYLPLTSEQKSSMKDEEIDLWQSKAKTGILRNDSNLNNFLLEIKSSLTDSVDNINMSLSELGITQSSDYSKRGQISIDSKKLSIALDKNADLVFKYFTNNSSSTDEKINYKSSGVFVRMKNIMNKYTNSYNSILVQKSGYTGSINELTNEFSKKNALIEKKITSLQELYKKKEDKLYKQFASLESAMNTLNSQSSWLSSLMSN